MTINWDDIADVFAKGLEQHKTIREVYDRLERDRANLGEAIWEAFRREAYTPDRRGDWEHLSHAPQGSWSDADLLALLRLVQGSKPLVGPESYEISVIPGWHHDLHPLLLGLDGEVQALVESWPELDEPVRSSLAMELARLGHIDAADLPDYVMPNIAARVARYCASYQLDHPVLEGLSELWPGQAWGRALIDAGLEEDLHEIDLDLIRPWLDQGSVEERYALVLKHKHSQISDALEVCFGLGDEVVPLLEQEARTLADDPELRDQYFPRQERCAFVALSLWRFYQRDGRGFPEELDGLLAAAQRFYAQDIFAEMRALLATFDQKHRREVLEPGFQTLQTANEYNTGSSELRYLTTLPEPDVAEGFIDVVVQASKRMYESNQKDLLERITELGDAAREPLMQELNKCKAPHRWVLIEALARLGHPEAVPTLLCYAGDSLQNAADAAIKGLKALAWDDLAEPLAAALGSRTKGDRLGAAALLTELPATAETKALAEARLKKEKVAAVKQLLEQVVAAPIREEGAADREGEPPHLAARARVDPSFAGELRGALSELKRRYEQKDVTWNQLPEEFEEIVLGQDRPMLDVALVTAGWWAETENPFPGKLFVKLLPEIKDAAETPWLALEVYEAALESSWGYLGQVAEALGGLEPLFEPALRLIRRDGVDTWDELARELVKAGCDEVLPFVVPLLDHKDKYLRQDWAELISEHAGSRAAPHLWPLLSDRKAGTRQRAAEYLERFPVPESAPPIAEALDRETNRKVSVALEAALAACTPLEVVEEGATAETDAALDAALAALPEARAGLPPLVDEAALPGLRWRSGAEVSDPARHWLLAMLTRESRERCNDNLWRVRRRLDPAASAELARELDAQYRARGTSNDDRAYWIYSQGLFGDDAVIEALGEPLDEMARNKQSAWSFHRLEALRRQAGPVAIYWLDVWGSTARSKGLRARAAEGFAALAEAEGVTAAELLGRARPPSHGFDAKGERAVTAGKHGLTLKLRPQGVTCHDASGEEVSWRALSRKIGASAAKEVKPIREAVDRSLEMARATLERAMVTGRTWRWEEWREGFGEHPILAACAPGVVFLVKPERGEPTSFTVDDKGKLRGVDGEVIEVSGEAVISVPHPLELSPADLAAWTQALGSLKLSQPFDQLERATYRFDPAEPTPFAAKLEVGAHLRPSQLLKKTAALGYQRGEIEDAGFYFSFSRPLAEGYTAYLNHQGLPVDMRYADPSVEVTGFGVLGPDGRDRLPKDLPPLVFTEALRDLTLLVG